MLISLASATPLANPIGYAGYVYLPDFGTLGHWLARHRIFDPVMGRWITRDPAGYVDGMSLYLYVGNNPLAFVDPSGLGKVRWFVKTVKGAWKAVTGKQAKNAIEKGKDIKVEGPGSSGAAHSVSKETFGEKSVRHDRHAPDQHDHYQHKNGGRGHINYTPALAPIVTRDILDPDHKNPVGGVIGPVVDFVNPLNDGIEVYNLVDEATNGALAVVVEETSEEVVKPAAQKSKGWFDSFVDFIGEGISEITDPCNYMR